VKKIAEAILKRSRSGKHFSIVAVAEGAMPKMNVAEPVGFEKKRQGAKAEKDRKKVKVDLDELRIAHGGDTLSLAEQLEKLTGLESRVTILGYLQRGGTPSAGDRLLATRLGTACAALIKERNYGVMLAARGEGTEPVPLEAVVGQYRTVPLDHPWIESARLVGTSLGD
jgi:6-phosphofructokinase